jgi:hypothetical protein
MIKKISVLLVLVISASTSWAAEIYSAEKNEIHTPDESPEIAYVPLDYCLRYEGSSRNICVKSLSSGFLFARTEFEQAKEYAAGVNTCTETSETCKQVILIEPKFADHTDYGNSR